MDESIFNIEIRRFLKEVGVTSQRAIERAVRQALQEQRLKGGEKLRARAVVTLEGVDLRHEIMGEISLG